MYFKKIMYFQQLYGSQRQSIFNPDVIMIWNTAGSWPSEIIKLYVFVLMDNSREVAIPTYACC